MKILKSRLFNIRPQILTRAWCFLLIIALIQTQASAATDAHAHPNIVFVLSPVGINFANNSPWLPDKNGNDIQLSASTSPLEEFKALSNFRTLAQGEGSIGLLRYMLSEGFTHSSFDLELAEALGPEKLYPLISLGIQSQGDTASYHNDTPLPTIEDPLKAREYLFGTESLLGGISSEDLQAMREHNQSMMTFFHGNHSTIEGFASFDSAKVQFINEYEGDESLGFKALSELPLTFSEHTVFHGDTIAQAIKQQKIQVATLLLGNADMEWLPDNSIRTAHNLCHTGFAEDRELLAEFVMEQFSTLLNSLNTVAADSGDSVLDNSLVVFVSNEGDCENHTSEGRATILSVGNNVTGFVKNTSQISHGTAMNFLGSIALGLGLDQSSTHIMFGDDNSDILLDGDMLLENSSF